MSSSFPSPAPGGCLSTGAHSLSAPTCPRQLYAPRAPLPAPHGQQQRAEAVRVPGVHVHTSLQQHGDGLCVASPGGRVQWGLAVKVHQAQVTALR